MKGFTQPKAGAAKKGGMGKVPQKGSMGARGGKRGRKKSPKAAPPFARKK